jgi:hypothetical protein
MRDVAFLVKLPEGATCAVRGGEKPPLARLCHFANSNRLNWDASLSKVITVSQPWALAE